MYARISGVDLFFRLKYPALERDLYSNVFLFVC